MIFIRSSYVIGLPFQHGIELIVEIFFRLVWLIGPSLLVEPRSRMNGVLLIPSLALFGVVRHRFDKGGVIDLLPRLGVGRSCGTLALLSGNHSPKILEAVMGD